jgi:hypothetical protein
MNEVQKIEEFFGNEERVLKAVAQATRGLTMHKGQSATYAESMDAFGYAFKGIASNLDLPNFQVRHPGMEVDAKANRRTNNHVFGNPGNRDAFAHRALIVWSKFPQPADFELTVTLYQYCFDLVASAHAALTLWGVDSRHHQIRTNEVMTARALQRIMPAAAKYPGFDRQVCELFDLLEAGKLDVAYTEFNRIREQHNKLLTFATERDFKDYLIRVNQGLSGADEVSVIIDDFEHWAEKYRINSKLVKTLKPKGGHEVAKI